MTSRNLTNVRLIAFFLFFANVLSAQSNLLSITEKFSEQLPQEKVFLTFDKPQYTVGDQMFFKAFLMSARTHAADSISGILYVNIFDAATKKVLTQRTFQIANSIAYGSIPAPRKGGEVVIQAYTKWMLNASADFHFNKKLIINDLIQENTPPSVSTPSTALKPYLTFFPEGGNLVTGLTSILAFKAVNELGNGVPINGVIVDETGVGVVIFKDEYLGMGSCSFTPVSGKTYTAQVTASDGKVYTYPLPAALGLGYVMTVDNLKDKDNVKVVIQTTMPDVAMPTALYLLAHTRGDINQVVQLDVLNKKTKAFTVNIAKEKLDKDGIVHLTLFNQQGQPLAERLIFVESKKKRLTVNLKTNKSAYKPREKVVLDIQTTDAKGAPMSAEIALVIANNDKVKTPQYAENLLSYTLLRSDLGGNIELPAYYLDDTSRRAKRALNHLMLTNGWRRFAWKEVLARDRIPTPQYLPEVGLTISGNVSEPKGDKKAIGNANLLVTLFNETEGNQPLVAETDKKGNFKLENLYFTDSTRVFLQVLERKKEFSFSLNAGKENAQSMPSTPFFEPINQNISDYLQGVREEVTAQKMRDIREIELQTLEVTGTKKRKPDSRAIYGIAPTMIEVDAKTASVYNNLIDYLNGRQGINVYQKNNSVYFKPFRGNSSIEGESQPLVMIDGFPTDAFMLTTISMVDVERVDIIRGASAIFGARGANGVVNVLTKTNSNVPKPKTKVSDETDLASAIVVGYSLVKQFYTPSYETPSKLNELPDHRTTIYWNPTLKTDTNGKAQVIYYNSDDAQPVRIVTEGWQKDGNLGVGKLEYSVKE
jgi:hypothetical protein